MADILVVFHLSLSDLYEMTLRELFDWHKRARVRSESNTLAKPPATHPRKTRYKK